MCSLIASTIYHPERSTPLTRRLRDHTFKRRLDQFTNLVGHAKPHGRHHTDCLMDAAEIVVCHEQADRSLGAGLEWWELISVYDGAMPPEMRWEIMKTRRI